MNAAIIIHYIHYIEADFNWNKSYLFCMYLHHIIYKEMGSFVAGLKFSTTEQPKAPSGHQADEATFLGWEPAREILNDMKNNIP